MVLGLLNTFPLPDGPEALSVEGARETSQEKYFLLPGFSVLSLQALAAWAASQRPAAAEHMAFPASDICPFSSTRFLQCTVASSSQEPATFRSLGGFVAECLMGDASPGAAFPRTLE